MTLPCGHEPPLFKTKTGENLPIALSPTEFTAPMAWCQFHGWVGLTVREYEQLGRHA